MKLGVTVAIFVVNVLLMCAEMTIGNPLLSGKNQLRKLSSFIYLV